MWRTLLMYACARMKKRMRPSSNCQSASCLSSFFANSVGWTCPQLYPDFAPRAETTMKRIHRVAIMAGLALPAPTHHSSPDPRRSKRLGRIRVFVCRLRRLAVNDVPAVQGESGGGGSRPHDG